MEHYIAIDNVCAWPNLTPLPDGTIAAIIFNQPTHLGWEGEAECWASEDDGRTWALRGVPAPHEPTTARGNVAAGLARDGSLIVLVSGWTHRNPVGEESSWSEAEVLPTLICRSADGGRTWQHEKEPIAAPPGTAHCAPYGDILQLPDGNLGVCLYAFNPTVKEQCSNAFYTSDDDGRSWTARGSIRRGDINETAPLVLPNGELLACARTVGDHHLDVFRSTDCGRTWKCEQAVSGKNQHPAHLLQLADGRILLTYGRRTKNAAYPGLSYRGLSYRLSSDGGRTWDPPVVLQESRHAADMEWPTSDGGYPANVQLEDGTIVTAYYSSGVPNGHDRYHMGVVRWKPETD